MGVGEGGVHILSSERFVVPTVVRASMADHAQQLVISAVQNAAQW